MLVKKKGAVSNCEIWDSPLFDEGLGRFRVSKSKHHGVMLWCREVWPSASRQSRDLRGDRLRHTTRTGQFVVLHFLFRHFRFYLNVTAPCLMKGLSDLEENSSFFAPKAYLHTSRGRKRRKKMAFNIWRNSQNFNLIILQTITKRNRVNYPLLFSPFSVLPKCDSPFL